VRTRALKNPQASCPFTSSTMTRTNADRVRPEPANPTEERMQAACVLEFGPPSMITVDDWPVAKPLQCWCGFRVEPWDTLLREGQSGLTQPLPLILGSDTPEASQPLEGTCHVSNRATRSTAQRMRCSPEPMSSMSLASAQNGDTQT